MKPGLRYPDYKSLVRWRRSIEGALSFMEQLNALTESRSTVWTTGMRRHYTAKVRYHLAHAPTGASADAKLYRQRLKALAGK